MIAKESKLYSDLQDTQMLGSSVSENRLSSSYFLLIIIHFCCTTSLKKPLKNR